MTNDNEDDDQEAQEAAQDVAQPPQAQGSHRYRVDAEGYIDNGKERVFVGRSLAGGLVTVSDPD